MDFRNIETISYIVSISIERKGMISGTPYIFSIHTKSTLMGKFSHRCIRRLNLILFVNESTKCTDRRCSARCLFVRALHLSA